MPNGKPGDHPLSDIVLHGTDVYSPTIDALVRGIAKLGGMELIADMLLRDFNEFSNPDLVKLEQVLTSIRDDLLRKAKHDG